MSTMRAMVLDRPHTPLVMRERPLPQPAAGRNPDRDRSVRRVPHRSACRRRRIAASQTADRAGARDRRPRRGARSGRRVAFALASASACRGSARPAASVPIAVPGARTCAISAVHRLYPRRRLRDAHAWPMRAFAFPLPEKPRRRGGGAAALRRPDRLAQLPHGRGGGRARPLRLRRRRAYSGAGRRSGRAGASTPSPAPATRPRKHSRARSARFGPAAPRTRRRNRSTPPSSSRRSARWCRRRSRAVKKGGRVVCGGIHMSDIPSFPYRLLWEERQLVSVANLTRRGRAGILGGRAAGRHQDAGDALSA